MDPVIAIVGRPNVGKSTLFNQLTRTRDALVHNMPGLTRDRQYGEVLIAEQKGILIDTGGLDLQGDDLTEKMTKQAWQAVEESQLVFFILDAKVGLTALDNNLLSKLRRYHKSLILVINKIDGQDEIEAISEFSRLGFPHIICISAAHGRGLTELMTLAASLLPQKKEKIETTTAHPSSPKGIRVAIVGRPNVGKSTLVNRILGEERVIAFDQPGTTTSSIEIPFTHRGVSYVLIDTAGVRRKSRITASVEKFSIIKSLQAIEMADVSLMLIDATTGLVDQDLRLIDFIIRSGKALVIAINKWDGQTQDDKDNIMAEIDRRLGFADFARCHFISALHGSSVAALYASIQEAYRAANCEASTGTITRLLEDAIKNHQPPLINGRRIKLRYAHIGSKNPLKIIIHGNQVTKLPDSYVRYLNHYFREKLNLTGAVLQLLFKSSKNPFAPKK